MSRPAILLVDDERTILDGLKDQLRRLFQRRFSYETAESAPEAWEIIDELVEDGVDVLIIVSDWLMPEVRGDEFLAQVRARHPNIVRILLTGQASTEALERIANESLAFRVMHKPWSADELQATIEAGLNQLD
jgi:CheY-like chemotaxis protein